MRRFAVLAALAACSFDKAVSSPNAGDDAPVVDAPPPPPPDACDDSDSDGVCNLVDQCPLGPDGDDSDGDALADACDDWPCGVKPASPAASVTWETGNENVTLSMIDVEAAGQRAVVTAGQMFAVAARYSIVDCQCPNCIDQIEIGMHTVGKAACLYNGNPAGSGNCNAPTIGNATRTVRAPTTPGLYQLRFNRGNDLSCQDNGAWWADVAPGAGNTFALICVK